MTTVDAAFDSWERRWAHYYAYGGDASVYAALTSANRLPGRTVKPESASSFVTLCRSTPVVVPYPNLFSLAGASALEPTSGEWQNYTRQLVTRDDAVSDSWEAAETSSGVWVVRNKSDIVFPAAGGSSSGITCPYATMLIPYYAGFGSPIGYYALLCHELDTQIVVPLGGTGDVTIPAQTLTFEFR